MSAGLLSRIAEVLFWTGRYIERADDTARMADVYVHRMLEQPHGSEDAGCRALLGVLGMPSPAEPPLDIRLALQRLAYDTGNPSAIAGAVAAARRGARSVREVISGDMWECLNVTARQLADRQRAAARLGPGSYLQFIRERSALFFGLADATMSHDDAWRFLILGRSVERADMTARLLLARMPDAPYELGWPLLLRACGAYESFLRTRGWAGAPEVAAFLLLDHGFPRSVLHALTVAEECLSGIEPTQGAARRVIGRLRTRLEYADPDQLPGQLADLLGSLQRECRQATDAVAGQYFTCEPAVAWAQEA